MGFSAAPWLVPSLLAASALAQQDTTAVVDGRAIDCDGKPAAGCAVGLFDLGESFDTKALLAAPATTTDAQGRFQLTAKRNHYHVVVVTTKGRQVCVQRLQSEDSAVRHMPDALMLPGISLRGRVRDDRGAPLAGARVRVEDPLTRETFAYTWFESQARSDDKGIFEVPGVPETGLRVTISALGYDGTSMLVAADSPLDVALTAANVVRGRVVDVDGKPVGGCQVNVVTAETRDGQETATSDAGGRFELTAPRATRFRVQAFEPVAPNRQFSSGLLHDAADDVVVACRSAPPPNARRITLRCVDAATKQPIETFRASYCGVDAAALALLHHPQARAVFRGEAMLDAAPGIVIMDQKVSEKPGLIVVDAPGHGHCIVRIPDDAKEPLIAELPAECVLTGQVLDAENGKPAAGAAVRALPSGSLGGGSPDPWATGVVTGDDGRYRIDGLAAGSYSVQVYGRGRPASRGKVVTVTDSQATLDLEVPKARWLEFELVGDIPVDCLGTITWGGGMWSYSASENMLDAQLPMPPNVPLRGPRTVKLGPIGNHDYGAQVFLPTRNRVGAGITLDLGKVGGPGTKLQLPDLRQCLHRGRVQLPDDVPAQRVAVVARTARRGARDRFAEGGLEAPFAACLTSEGGFVIDLPPGDYALQLVDLETGIVFHTEEQDRRLDADSAATELRLAPTTHWLEVVFTSAVDGAPVVCQSVQFELQRARNGTMPAMLRTGSRRNDWDRGSASVRYGARSVRWLVPGGTVKLRAVQTFAMLAPSNQGWQYTPVEGTEIEVADREHKVTLRLPPPPSDEEILAEPKHK